MRITSEVPVLPGALPQSPQSSKLVEAAHQFEASMLQELLKPLQAGQDSWGGGDSEGDSAFDTIRSFGTEAVAKAISDGGGFGIARQVVSQINAEHQRKAPK